MSPSHPGAGVGLRALAFASADGAAWGAAIGDADGWSLVTGPATASGPASVTELPDGGWRLESADGTLSLVAAADGPPSPPPADGDEPPAPAFVAGEGPELCRVTGTASGRQVQWQGVRAQMATQRPAKDDVGSARLVAGWFGDGSAVGLIAARPRRHDRPDHDVASATLFDGDRWLPVTEPRLSTTYDRSDTPSRVSLELWVGEGEHEYPRRAAGEASGPAVATTGEGRLQVTPLRCHSRGEEGVGVYVLATF